MYILFQSKRIKTEKNKNTQKKLPCQSYFWQGSFLLSEYQLFSNNNILYTYGKCYEEKYIFFLYKLCMAQHRNKCCLRKLNF